MRPGRQWWAPRSAQGSRAQAGTSSQRAQELLFYLPGLQSLQLSTNCVQPGQVVPCTPSGISLLNQAPDQQCPPTQPLLLGWGWKAQWMEGREEAGEEWGGEGERRGEKGGGGGEEGREGRGNGGGEGRRAALPRVQ